MKKLFLLLQILWATALFAQPTGACTPGTTQMSTDGRLYGCTQGVWKRLSEVYPFTGSNTIPNTVGITQLGNFNRLFIREADNTVRALPNTYYSIISTIPGQTHEIGKVIYTKHPNDLRTDWHFYQSVNNQWIQMDNSGILLAGWVYVHNGNKLNIGQGFRPKCHKYLNDPITVDEPEGGIWVLNSGLDSEEETGTPLYHSGCNCRGGREMEDPSNWPTECP